MALEIGGYRLDEVIRRGARSVVYRATRAADGHRVVVKTTADVQPTSEALEGLRREHEILAGVDHPSVVRALDLVDHGKGLALVQEHRPGESLERLLGGSHLSTVAASRLAVAVAQALAAVHAAGVVHRKVHPGNILVHEATGTVTLVDFGRATLGRSEALDAVDPGLYGDGLPYVEV